MSDLQMEDLIKTMSATMIKAFADRVKEAPIIIIAGNPETQQLTLSSNISNKNTLESVLMDILKTSKAEDVAEEFAQEINDQLEEPPENGQE
jgi:hypothetical protein